MLLAAILTFGQILYSAQTLQQAADVAARELSRVPLAPTADLMDVLYGNTGYENVRNSVFDQTKLHVDLTSDVPSGQTVLDFVKTWPIVNQMLYPVMIIVRTEDGHSHLVYPGVVSCTDAADRTVPCIARVDGRSGNGAETITWVPVIEEVTPGAFSVASSQHGLVTLRINYPYQSASMSSFRQRDLSVPIGPSNQVAPNEADDNSVTTGPDNTYNPNGNAPLQSASNDLYNGQYGLGTQYAWAKNVRPYRSLISAQAIYRREAFSSQ